VLKKSQYDKKWRVAESGSGDLGQRWGSSHDWTEIQGSGGRSG
jgi:hypothetical protein